MLLALVITFACIFIYDDLCFKFYFQQHLNEGAKQMAVLSTAVGALERARRSYERAARESERALDAFQKADKDFNLR